MRFATLLQDGPWAGWLQWQDPEPVTFLHALGPSYSRSERSGTAVVMLETRPDHRNRADSLHGGLLAAFADHAYFAGLTAMGRPEQVWGATVDLSMQYLGAGTVGPELRAEVEVLRETGRLFFMRLTIAQEDRLVAASTATLRKGAEPR